MNPFKNRTKNQKEILKLQQGNFAYIAHMNDTVVPEIIQIKITGECEEGDGYLALMTANEPYQDYVDYEGNVTWLTSSEVHTCNMTLWRSKKEAKEYAKKLVQKEIQSLKEQQSVISKNIAKYMLFQNHPPTYKPFNPNKVFIAPPNPEDS
jgi:ABC-type Zn2+ transport system substrate-binding protein/surface adhesin